MVSSSGCALVAGAPSLPGAAGRDASVSAPRVHYRFPRSCRLTARKQFLTVYGRGRRVGSRSLTLFGLPNALDTCRLGITVTRKVGSSARRNRIKRILRDVFRRRRGELTPELDLVVNAHPSMGDRSHAEIELEFMTSFARLAKAMPAGPRPGAS